MNSEIDANYAPLPGYRLTARLGAGGYGEVWRAEAPGGLTKAIKLVFGQQHEKRATRELRALELIKQLRHPFLLSLERIEIVDGRLIIVTELAEGSVKDRFDACRQEHLPGIPRDELLRYLRDAADALDYMSDTHGLQHLDIKPENLLLLACHVKVADFGLVKDVKQSEASLVGGMTPLYAAPEVFRGQPSRQSDQYALAIVYQEMLTGGLPFVGSNAAELTLQHLNDEPDLSSLSSADRYVISRALSKEPTHRYGTCGEFVEALLHVESAGSTFCGDNVDTADQQPVPAWCGATVPTHNSPTELFDDDELAGEQASLLIDQGANERGVTDLPPIRVDANAFRPAPTLFLGIGGAAGRVLAHLRQAIHEQFGDAPLPAVQMLLIDTDPKALAEISRGDGRGLEPEETIHVPLRRPQHYRERWDQLLSWLSRRWLYNIPKSMRTEGLRPLGRLAFVDHARQTCQRIRKAMLQATAADSLEASAAAFGCELRRDAARVYIVASVSGGTGSGMVLDAAYAVRTLLEKLDLPATTVIGVMMHSTGRDPRHGELARVNAFSWLTEFQHFHRPGGAFPGDASCGLPNHEPGVTAFDHTYFVHLGDGLDDGDFDRQAQSVADYLRLDALTPAQVALDVCRQSAADEGSGREAAGGVNLRSFGTYRRTAAPSGFCEETAAVICSRLLGAWRTVDGRAAAGEPSRPSSVVQANHQRDPSDELSTGNATALVRRLQLTPAGLAANARILVEANLGNDADAFLSRWLAERFSADQYSERRQLEAVDDIFGGGGDTGGDGERAPTIVGRHVADVVEPLAEEVRSQVRRWVFLQLDDPQQRLAGTMRAIDWLGHHFQSIGDDTRRLRHSLAERLAELRPRSQPADQAAAPPIAGNAQRVNNYFQLRLDQLALDAVDYVVRLIRSELKSIGDDLTTFGRELGQMAAVATNCSGSGVSDSQSPAAQGSVIAKVQSRLSELLASVDAQLQSEYIDNQGGLYQTVMQGGRPRAQLGAKMQDIARRTVQKALTNLDGGGPDLSDAEGNAEQGGLRSAVAASMPSLLEFGGARRVLAVLSPDAAPQVDTGQYSQALGTSVSIVAGSGDGFTICIEAEQLSLVNVAIHIVQRRRDSVEFAKRVHTRSDVRWTPLLAPPAEKESPRYQPITTLPITTDQCVRQTEVL